MGRDDDGVPGGGEVAQHRAQGGLRGVVETPGRLVEKDDLGPGGELHGEDEGEPATFGEVARVPFGRYARCQPLEMPRARPGVAPALPIGLAALGANSVEIEEVAGGLGDEADPPAADVRGEGGGVGAVREPHPPPRPSPGALQRPEGGLARPVAAHECRHAPDGELDVDPRDREDTSVLDAHGIRPDAGGVWAGAAAHPLAFAGPSCRCGPR